MKVMKLSNEDAQFLKESGFKLVHEGELTAIPNSGQVMSTDRWTNKDFVLFINNYEDNEGNYRLFRNSEFIGTPFSAGGLISNLDNLNNWVSTLTKLSLNNRTEKYLKDAGFTLDHVGEIVFHQGYAHRMDKWVLVGQYNVHSLYIHFDEEPGQEYCNLYYGSSDSECDIFSIRNIRSQLTKRKIVSIQKQDN
ncbi:hypothetical protein CEW46_28585 [Bacillus cereus]|nr:hypothetical protein CEW46_28585 [Bacillus cereus]